MGFPLFKYHETSKAVPIFGSDFLSSSSWIQLTIAAAVVLVVSHLGSENDANTEVEPKFGELELQGLRQNRTTTRTRRWSSEDLTFA